MSHLTNIFELMDIAVCHDLIDLAPPTGLEPALPEVETPC